MERQQGGQFEGEKRTFDDHVCAGTAIKKGKLIAAPERQNVKKGHRVKGGAENFENKVTWLAREKGGGLKIGKG